jgi:epoxide hydrolase-like predicted phosphatase
MMDFSKVKNIVFDLGGVIINIDFEKTYQALAVLSGINIDEARQKAKELELFVNYEKGRIEESDFIALIKESFCSGKSDLEIRHAWNALLMDIPIARIELLKKLKSKYNLYLLSNTNFTHIVEVNAILDKTCGVRDLKQLFTKVYYSYEMNLLKPDVEIYEYICKDSGLNPAETVFLDDLPANIEGAREAGLHVLHVQEPMNILELLKHA